MWVKFVFRCEVSVWIVVVLVRFGVFFISRWLLVSSVISRCLISVVWLMILVDSVLCSLVNVVCRWEMVGVGGGEMVLGIGGGRFMGVFDWCRMVWVFDIIVGCFVIGIKNG